MNVIGEEENEVNIDDKDIQQLNASDTKNFTSNNLTLHNDQDFADKKAYSE